MQQTVTAPPPTGPVRTWQGTYPGTADQIRHVRAALRPLLHDCPATDDVILLVDELAANAIMHSHSGRPDGTFTVRLQHVPGDHVRAEVQDQGGTWDGDLVKSARHAHGLYLLLTLSTRCGIENGPQSRTAWFRIDCLPPRPPAARRRSCPTAEPLPMAGTAPITPAGQPARDDLTARVFRALYAGFDLHTVGDTYIAVPKGAPCFAGPSLGDLARQISDREHPDLAALAPGTLADHG